MSRFGAPDLPGLFRHDDLAALRKSQHPNRRQYTITVLIRM